MLPKTQFGVGIDSLQLVLAGNSAALEKRMTTKQAQRVSLVLTSSEVIACCLFHLKTEQALSFECASLVQSLCPPRSVGNAWYFEKQYFYLIS